MADTCAVYIKFGGKISRQAAKDLIAVLKDQGYYWDDGSGGDPEMGNIDEDFCCDEVNYANIDAIGLVCREHGIDYHMTHGAGDSFAAGCVRLMGGRHEECVDDDGPLVPLKKVLEVETLASGLADLIDLARFMLGDFPNLEIVDTTVSDAAGARLDLIPDPAIITG